MRMIKRWIRRMSKTITSKPSLPDMRAGINYNTYNIGTAGCGRRKIA